MAYICSDPEKYRGQPVVGGGQCVELVVKACGAPPSSSWSQGAKVKSSAPLLRGTAIATFFNGKYPNKATGNHAAIYLSHGPQGIEVLDQWKSHDPAERTIHYLPGDDDPANDGDFYYVVE